ncbi:MAG: twin-arginine translocation signal domain-containing protein, partial [Thermodesulfobacteriota bacterium]
MDKDNKNKPKDTKSGSNRRDFIKTSTIAAGAVAAAMTVPGVSAGAAETECQPTNPYGSRPGGGVSLPDYYKPWPAIKNNNFYIPGQEILPKNEMRIFFLGSTPW